MGVSGRPRPERVEAPNLRQHGARRELSYLSKYGTRTVREGGHSSMSQFVKEFLPMSD